MAGFRLLAPIPPMTLDAGCSITFEAIDPTNGASVTGVAISFATIYVTNVLTDASVPEEETLLTLEQLESGPVPT